MLFPEEILDALFGAAYTPGAIPLRILALAQLVNVSTGSVGFMLVMTNRQTQWMWITASALLINLGGGIWVIPRFGLTGAASVSAAATIWMFSMGLFQVHRDLHLWPYDKRFLKGALSAMGTVLALAALKFLLHTNSWLLIGGAGFLSVTVFFVGLWLGGWDEEDRVLLPILRQRWRHIRNYSKI
jgi:O-antigen/teichoic acid export membrane protein